MEQAIKIEVISKRDLQSWITRENGTYRLKKWT
jgi:hypothetical protein